MTCDRCASAHGGDSCSRGVDAMANALMPGVGSQKKKITIIVVYAL